MVIGMSPTLHYIIRDINNYSNDKAHNSVLAHKKMDINLEISHIIRSSPTKRWTLNWGSIIMI
jgi:hypothetical protein